MVFYKYFIVEKIRKSEVVTFKDLQKDNIYNILKQDNDYNSLEYDDKNITPLENFTNINTSPNQGEIYLWFDTGSTLAVNPGGATGVIR